MSAVMQGEFDSVLSFFESMPNHVIRCLTLLSCAALVGSADPIALHPDNPHYFIYNGKPTVLVTSAEHYGAVLNLDFDYETYLDTLAVDGMNYTRIFVGSYVEIPGSFGIENNTLAPAVGRFLSPWQKTDQPGLYEGESKWDLSKFSDRYFARLRAFVTKARQNGIIVEVTLFCSTYQDSYWKRHPFNPGNNINGLSPLLTRQQSTTRMDEPLHGLQKRLAAKIVQELNEFDNVFYEIQNEPWADNGVKATRMLKTLEPKSKGGDWYKWAETATPYSLAWQRSIAQTIVDTEASLPNKHLIAQNYTNFKHALTNVDPNISILNFHYAWPEAVTANYAWNRPICFDESGFAGSEDATYLRQAWAFLLAGGAMFNNLDYSFSVGHETGNAVPNAPGCGSATLRKQLGYLHEFLDSVDFIRMRPDLTTVHHAPGFEWTGISEPGQQYALFFHGPGSDEVTLNLPAGSYAATFVSPVDRKTISERTITVPATGAPTSIRTPPNQPMWGLRLVRQ